MSKIDKEEKDILIKYGLDGEDKFRYMMLSRFQADCKYFLGNGNRHNKDLWAKDPNEHIKIMKALYNSLPTPPDWITMKEIKNYEKELNKESKQKKSKERDER